MTVWDRACSLGYGIGARWHALGHLVRGHDVRWRSRPDFWAGCTGDIICENCPDSSGSGIVFWCRHKRSLTWITQRICGGLGHSELRHPTQWRDGADVEIVTEWYCYRCAAEVRASDRQTVEIR